jgi:hypothetical protein
MTVGKACFCSELTTGARRPGVPKAESTSMKLRGPFQQQGGSNWVTAAAAPKSCPGSKQRDDTTDEDEDDNEKPQTRYRKTPYQFCPSSENSTFTIRNG